MSTYIICLPMIVYICVYVYLHFCICLCVPAYSCVHQYSSLFVPMVEKWLLSVICLANRESKLGFAFVL